LHDNADGSALRFHATYHTVKRLHASRRTADSSNLGKSDGELSAAQIVTTLTLTNPVPNLTLGLSGAPPDQSSFKVRACRLSATHLALYVILPAPHG